MPWRWQVAGRVAALMAARGGDGVLAQGRNAIGTDGLPIISPADLTAHVRVTKSGTPSCL